MKDKLLNLLIIVLIIAIVGTSVYIFFHNKETTITAVKLDNNKIDMYVGESYKLNAYILPEEVKGSNLIWTSDNELVVSVINDGIVTSNSVGEATIKVTTKDGKYSDKCLINVKEKEEEIKIEDVKLDKSEIELKIGESVQLNVEIIPKEVENKTVTWTSDNDSIVKVDEKGLINGLASGEATIKVIVDDIERECMVKVVEVTPTPTPIIVKYKVTFNANGGSVSEENREVIENMTIGDLPTPIRNGYKFLGWFTDLQGGNQVWNKTAITSDMIVYAHWEEEALPAREQQLQSGFKLVTSYSSDTFKYWIERSTNSYKTYGSSDIYFTHIWMKDPVNQMKVALGGGTSLGNNKPEKLMNNEINRLSLTDKALVAVNASFFGDSKVSSWGSTQSTPVIIHEGRLLRDDSEKDLSNKIIYSAFGITRDGDFKFYDMEASQRVQSRNQMLSDGVKYSAVAWGLISKSYTDTASASRTMVCKLDKNNYILFTAYKLSFKDAGRVGDDILGCKELFNLDGGGSTTLLYKDKGSLKKSSFCTGRNIADMLYFVE